MGGKRIGQPPEDIPFNVQDKFDNVFLDNHIFFLSGDINEENILKATQWLVYENAYHEPEKILQLYINSTGGDLYQALGLIDMMRISKNRVRTIGVGAVMSFQAGGNVGIGTSSPNNLLQVGGGAVNGILARFPISLLINIFGFSFDAAFLAKFDGILLRASNSR